MSDRDVELGLPDYQPSNNRNHEHRPLVPKERISNNARLSVDNTVPENSDSINQPYIPVLPNFYEAIGYLEQLNYIKEIYIPTVETLLERAADGHAIDDIIIRSMTHIIKSIRYLQVLRVVDPIYKFDKLAEAVASGFVDVSGNNEDDLQEMRQAESLLYCLEILNIPNSKMEEFVAWLRANESGQRAVRQGKVHCWIRRMFEENYVQIVIGGGIIVGFLIWAYFTYGDSLFARRQG